MKYLPRIVADAIFVFHLIIVMIGLFGWMIKDIWYLYMGILIIILISSLTFGYCFISKWEFLLRKMKNPELSYNFDWTSFYTYKFTNNKLSNTFIKNIVLFFVTVSIIINLYFHYFY